MADLKSLNNDPLNQACADRLREAKAPVDPHYLFSLQLAKWGLEQSVEVECPPREKPELEMQVDVLFGWKAENAQAWLLSNPNGPSPKEQEDGLVLSLEQASSPQAAASLLLGHLFSRQQAGAPALQPAASESE